MFTCLPVSRKSTTWLSASAPDLQSEHGRARDPRFRSPVCYPVNRGPEILSEKFQKYTRHQLQAVPRGVWCSHPVPPRSAPSGPAALPSSALHAPRPLVTGRPPQASGPLSRDHTAC